ncbi:MAG TPA: holo-ACP synthase [Alphaproteobacteria bacterium]|nr:holo-ACP synthase [Alphaproteobacteria bacterium]
MIIGVGTDLVDVRRIEKSVERFGKAFCDRIYTPAEQAVCDARAGKRRLSAYAARFAAKEACSKALGTGLRQGVSWRDMENAGLPTGQPAMRLTGGALKRLRDLTPAGHIAKIDVSLTDEYPYASAFVVISAQTKG